MPRFRRVQIFHLHSVLQVTPRQGMESIQHAGTPPQEPVASQSQVFVLMGYLLCLMLLLSLMKKLAGLTAKGAVAFSFSTANKNCHCNKNYDPTSKHSDFISGTTDCRGN